MRRAKHGFLVALALVSCPCHAALLVALLAGTGLGAVVGAHTGLLVGALTLVFLGAVAGLLLAGREAPQRERTPEAAQVVTTRAGCCTVPDAPGPARTGKGA